MIGFAYEHHTFTNVLGRVRDVGYAFLRGNAAQRWRVHHLLHYHTRGFRTAIDDFGAGYSGLNLLAELQTDFIKLDMALIRHIDRDRPRQAIVKGILQVCRDLGIAPIAEGVETAEEVRALEDFGIELFQGYFFARPAFEAQAVVSFGAEDPTTRPALVPG